MTEQKTKPGPGRFQWNRGGWFGAQVGATAWLLLLGGLMLGQGRMGGAVVLALALAANGVGFWLWSQRNEREPYPSIQMMLGACAVVAFVWMLERLFETDLGVSKLVDPLVEAPQVFVLLGVGTAMAAALYLYDRRNGTLRSPPPTETADEPEPVAVG